MNTIQDFIQSASKSIGTNNDATQSATAGVLNMIKGKVDAGQYQKLLGSLPGADAIGGKGGESGGLLGSVGGALSGALGGKLGGAASAMAMFEKSGLDLGQAGQFVTMFVGFAKDKAGNDLVNQILGKMPEIKKLIK